MAELRDALIAAHRQYSDAMPRLSYTKGTARFFGDGDWRNAAVWPWKPGAQAAQPRVRTALEKLEAEERAWDEMPQEQKRPILEAS